MLTNVWLQGSEAVLALLEVAAGVSRVHASRRFFEYLARHDIDIPVIHHRSFEAGKSRQSLDMSPLRMPVMHGRTVVEESAIIQASQIVSILLFARTML